jgi:hypothetical protein
MDDARDQDLASLESAALHAESLERIAEQRFDATYEAAVQRGDVTGVTATPEFRDWMAARADTDTAWGRWVTLMDGA